MEARFPTVGFRSDSSLDGTVATRRQPNAQTLHLSVRTSDVAAFGLLHISGPLAQIVEDLTLILILPGRSAVLARSKGPDHSKRLFLNLHHRMVLSP
jgi:hypothetical protein